MHLPKERLSAEALLHVQHRGAQRLGGAHRAAPGVALRQVHTWRGHSSLGGRALPERSQPAPAKLSQPTRQMAYNVAAQSRACWPAAAKAHFPCHARVDAASQVFQGRGGVISLFADKYAIELRGPGVPLKEPCPHGLVLTQVMHAARVAFQARAPMSREL